MEITLKLISGIAWTIVYIVLIRQGFKYKSYGMPLLALGLNIAWECIYSFYQINIHDISLQRGINIAWFLFDIVIVYQYFRFGKKYFPKRVNGKLFIPWSILAIAMCVVIQVAFLLEFGGHWGPRYSAFLQNLLMSFLFIDFFFKLDNVKEASLTVAIAKWLGTLAPTILFGQESNFILTIGICCSVIDIIYIAIVYTVQKKAKLETSPT